MASVLLVESNPDMREIYAEGLVSAGYEVVAANTAQSALDALDERQPDIVVLEISLPVHNGISVMYEMKSYGDWAKIPIVVLSSISKDDFQVPLDVWQQLNVVDYLHKTDVRPADLAAKLLEYIQ